LIRKFGTALSLSTVLAAILLLLELLESHVQMALFVAGATLVSVLYGELISLRREAPPDQDGIFS